MFTDEDRQLLLELSYGMTRCERRLHRIERAEYRMENEMIVDFSKLIASATKQQGVLNSVKQFCQDNAAAQRALSDQFAAAIAAGGDPVALKAVQDQIDASAKGFDDNDDAIAAAIAAPGTPGTTPPPA